MYGHHAVAKVRNSVILELKKYPDPILRKRAQPVERITDEIMTLVDDMIATMLKEEGVGLAANQIGVLKRIFVLNTTPGEEKAVPEVFINPQIIDRDEMVQEEEGCLSFPELYIKIDRADRVRVHARNIRNEDVVYEMSGLLARAIQHEIDHLDGVLIIDHTTTPEDQALAEKYKSRAEDIAESI